MQVPAVRPGFRRPGGQVAPLVRAGDEDPHRLRPQRGAVPGQVRAHPGQGVGDPRLRGLLVRVPPRADEQVRVPARGAQRRIVAKLQRQEDVVPSADHADRGGYLAARRGEATALPVLVVRCVVGQPVLPVRHAMTGGQPVEVAQRQMVKQRAPAPLGKLVAQRREGPLLARDLAHPAHGRVQRERPARVERGAEVGGGHLGGDRAEVRPRVRRDGPLGHAEVARAAGAEGTGVPRLLSQPGDRREAVVVLVGPERVERAARAEGAAAALDHGLEPPLGEQPAEQQPPRPAPPVGRADQHQRRWRPQWPGPGPRCVAVGEQHRPVRHRDPQVTIDVDGPGSWRAAA